MSDWSVGQTVYAGYSYSPEAGPKLCVVTKVGRRWVTASGDHWWREIRFDKNTGEADEGDWGWSLHAEADGFAKMLEAKARHERLDQAWRDLARTVALASRPEHLSLEQIEAIAAMLTPTPLEPKP